MKKNIFLTLVGFFLIFSFGTVQASFIDVTDTHKNYVALQWLESRQVIEGYEDGTFRPEQPVNRAEALKIILLGSGISFENEANGELAYSDVKNDDWFFPYVLMATEQGWVQGYGNGEFRPDQNINLAEALKIISLIKENSLTSPDSNPYFDVDKESWFAPYIEYAKGKNLISARSDGLLHPGADLARGDLIEIIYRLSYLENFGIESFDIALNWLEIQNQQFSYALKSPFNWQTMVGSNGEMILWHDDGANSSEGWMRTSENSATLAVFVNKNEEKLNTSDYFKRVLENLNWTDSSTISNTINENGYESLLLEKSFDNEVQRDLYTALPNGLFLIMQANYGKGHLQEQLAAQVAAIQKTGRYVEGIGENDPSAIIEQARKAIQVDGQGQAILGLFPDLELIETDSIGVGTGPVDYYYSTWANLTLKYERSFDVILDVAEGRTSAF